MPLTIRPFHDADIDFALLQTRREGWDNTGETFRVLLAHDPGDCFIAEVDSQPAAMITTTRYARSAWVGNLIVPPQFRRRGIGQRLMQHALDHLEAVGIKTFWLEADPMGVSIYKRLGFVERFESPRFSKSPPHDTNSNIAKSLHDSDLDDAYELDARCFGDDRSRLLRGFFDVSLAAYTTREHDTLTGFAMALPSAAGVRFGPCVVERPSAAAPLLDAVLRDFPDKPIIAAVPAISSAAIDLLQSRGFTPTSSCLRMQKGPADAMLVPNKLLTLANGATG